MTLQLFVDNSAISRYTQAIFPLTHRLHTNLVEPLM
jgi:hypothetical protein